jgi:Kef-type K+ transport system membrane component KefB
VNTILTLGFVLISGFFAARILRKIKLPAVTIYLVLGIIAGPHLCNFISADLLKSSGLISNIVLGFIAFTIGQNFLRDTFARIGRQVLWISVFEASGAWIMVTLLFLLILHQPLYLSFIFGAISAATAPAATVMVVREYNAKGPFTETLLGIVAIDDAWCLIIFAISLAVAKVLYVHTESVYLIFRTILHSLIEIGGSFVLGGCFAWLLHKLSGYLRTKEDLLIYILAFILVNTGLAIQLHLSVLLANMSLGAILINLDPANFRFFDTLKSIDPPLYLLFFVLAGAHLEISALSRLGVLGVGYLIFRVLGKSIGAWIGGQISRSTSKIKKYIGLGLVPQAGVALGVALIAQAEFPEVGGFILTVIVATTVVYEIVGPVCTKIALHRAGEI